MLPPAVYARFDPDLGAESEEDARIAAATAAVRRYCGWHIAPVLEHTFTVDGAGWQVMLPTLRLVDVLEVLQDDVTVDLDTLEWSHDGYIRGLSTYKLRGVQVTIQHGFESAPDLAQIVSEVAGRAQVSGVKSMQLGNRTVTYAEPGLMMHEQLALAAYRLPGLA